MDAFGISVFEIIFTLFFIIIFDYPTISKRKAPFRFYRNVVMMLFGVIGIILLLFLVQKEPFYIFKRSPYTTYSILAITCLFMPLILRSLLITVQKFKITFNRSISAFLHNFLDIKSFLINYLICSIIEEVIFRSLYCNLLLESNSNQIYVVVFSSFMYSITRISYYISSPRAHTNQNRLLVKDTIRQMFLSFVYSSWTSYIWIKSHSLHAIVYPNIVTSFYNFADLSRLLNEKNETWKTIYRISTCFGILIFVCSIMMFVTM